MNKFKLLIAVILFAFSFNALAEQAAPKIGVVSVREILENLPEAAAIAKKLEHEFEGRKEEILTAQKNLKTSAENFKKDMDVLSDAEKQRLQKEIFEQQQALQKMERSFRADGAKRQQEETQKVLKKISDIIDTVAKKEKYDLILQRDATPFVSDKYDVTPKVKRLVLKEKKKNNNAKHNGKEKHKKEKSKK